MNLLTSENPDADGYLNLALGSGGAFSGKLCIGGYSAPLVGAFDSFQLYDRALTTAQLCAIAGQPATCLQ